MGNYNFSTITPAIRELSEMGMHHNQIAPELFDRYQVKRGLRDENGKGVLTGLTNVSDVCATKVVEGKTVPCAGELYYRGINVRELIDGFLADGRFGYEETAYLLLFGELPDQPHYEWICRLLADYRSLPTAFVRDVILKSPSANIMNTLARGVLTLYSYDEMAEDTSLPNVLRQSLELIALLPLLAVYGYQAHTYYHEGDSLVIRPPKPELSTAENILQMLRPDGAFTELEARVLDLALVLHAEHGGGNNSTFTARVVTTSGTDTYSAIAAALASLKGPKHGGANIKVVQMFEDLKQKVDDWEDEEQLRRYLSALLRREAFDGAGLIYGVGHAVYSVSDPRAEVFRSFVEKLSRAKGMQREYALYDRVAALAPQVIAEERHMFKGVSANIDFYSGFVYRMLDLPLELYTPIFAIARVTGWSAHRLEELATAGKIIRPAYANVCPHHPYVPMDRRHEKEFSAQE
ncbi:citrate synthase [Anaerofilum sp. BX8]|uniref:citrate synthase (unknown stereospecificity) n=1 Tax=Anaerofilum hominis TaxID=2763016 RepID=A0A923I6N3_9FIRM|nr:citrate synthase [Anaerofilum hominis]MBC5581283.1 citrate synthase [Anaerofilum hominis]